MESEMFGHERGAFTGAVGSATGVFRAGEWRDIAPGRDRRNARFASAEAAPVLSVGKVRRLGGTHEFSFDVRVVAATNRDPLRAIQDFRLQEDLYYRLMSYRSICRPFVNSKTTSAYRRAFRRRAQPEAELIPRRRLRRRGGMLKSYPSPGMSESFGMLSRGRSFWRKAARWTPRLCFLTFAHPPRRQGSLSSLLAPHVAEAERELIVRTLRTPAMTGLKPPGSLAWM